MRAARSAVIGAFVLAWSPVMAETASQRWPEFQIIIWQGQAAAAYAGLHRLGITAGAITVDRAAPGHERGPQTDAMRDAGLRWYVENIATDFYAPYHRYLQGEPINAMFLRTQQRWQENPSDPAVFFRTPSLSDRAWQERIDERLRRTVQAHAPDHPLFYDLGDETGIADLTAAWDFDRSPASLAAMRAWLGGRYASLAELNAEWGTDFTTWADIMPMTTAEALRVTDGNYAAWSDFKEWMDEAFSRAIQAGTAAVHAADPAALSAIEGAQRPGPGGYDYSRLAQAVDVMEIYPDADNLEIAESFDPTLILLTTSGGDDQAAHRAVWEAMLRGSRGLVVWDDGHDIVLPDGSIGPRGRLAAPFFAELHGPAVAALLAATPVVDPVAILYSPESDRVGWLLDRRSGGTSWPARDADIENEETKSRASRRRMSMALLHRGIRPQWVTPEQVAHGDGLAGIRLLLLPQTIALSDAAIAAIARFSSAGGMVIGDGEAGQFDEHGRRRIPPVPVIVRTAESCGGISACLNAAGVRSAVTVTDAATGAAAEDVAIRMSRNGSALIVSLLRDASADANPREVAVGVRVAGVVTDLRTGKELARGGSVKRMLDNSAPVMLAVVPMN